MFGKGEFVLEELAADRARAGYVGPQVLLQDVRPRELLLARSANMAAAVAAAVAADHALVFLIAVVVVGY